MHKVKRGPWFFSLPPWFWYNAVQSTGRCSWQTSSTRVKAAFSENLMSKFAIRVLRSILRFFAQQRIKRPEPILAPKFLLLLTDDNNKPATLKKIATWWKHKQPITWGSFWVCAYFLQCWWKANGWMMIAKEAISSSQMNVHLMDCLSPPQEKEEIRSKQLIN